MNRLIDVDRSFMLFGLNQVIWKKVAVGSYKVRMEEKLVWDMIEVVYGIAVWKLCM